MESMCAFGSELSQYNLGEAFLMLAFLDQFVAIYQQDLNN